MDLKILQTTEITYMTTFEASNSGTDSIYIQVVNLPDKSLQPVEPCKVYGISTQVYVLCSDL